MIEGIDTFTTTAPRGSFASKSADDIVYVGDHGMGWTEYPDGWPSTNSSPNEGYQPASVQSVHDGMLDFYLHDDPAGHPVGANISPLPGGNRYQTYGVWSFCERVAPADSHHLADFRQAPLLWPRSFSAWAWAEADYPEGNLNGRHFLGFAHYGGAGKQQYFFITSVEPRFDPTKWHVYTQAWGPGFRSFYVDGRLLGTTTKQVWAGPERWQLQIEPSLRGGRGSGHVYVKWVWIGTGPARRSHRTAAGAHR